METAAVIQPNTPPASTADREIVVTRLIAAPRALVFAAFLDPANIGTWWGPNGFTTTIHAMDARPGGVWRYIMHGPDGTDYNNRVTYVEIVKPERIVYDHGDDENPTMFRSTITFAERGGKTKLTMRATFESVAAYTEATKFGAVEGGTQTLDRLEQYLARA